MIAIFQMLSVNPYLLLAICYLLSYTFYVKLAFTCKNLFSFARCCMPRNFYCYKADNLWKFPQKHAWNLTSQKVSGKFPQFWFILSNLIQRYSCKYTSMICTTFRDLSLDDVSTNILNY